MQELCNVGVRRGASRGPKQAGADFIADRDDRGLYAGFLKFVHDVFRIVVELPAQVVDGCWPTRWDCLVPWVSPCVAVVEVNVDSQSGGLGSLRQYEVVCKVVVAVGWIYPNPLSDSVDAIGLQDLLQRLRLPTRGLVRDAGPLLDDHRGPVHSLVC